MFSVAKTVSSIFLIVVLLTTSLPPTAYAEVSVPTLSGIVSSLQSILARLRGVQSAQVITATGLVAAYNMNEGSGTTLTDVTGNGRTGSFSGTPEWGTGKNGGGLTYTSGDNVNLGNQLPIQGVTQVTVSAWMKRAAQNNAVIIGKQGSSGIDSVSMEFWTDGNLYFGLSDSSSFAGGSVALNDTAWHHVTLVFNGSLTGNANRLKGYVDGQPATLSFIGTVPAVTTSATTPFGIGYLSGAYTTGQIDDVRVYTRALSASEVLSDMNTSLGSSNNPATPQNGVCGTSHNSTLTSAPSVNLCSVGTASSVTSNTNSYNWSCAGSSGGTTAQCSAGRSVAAPSGTEYGLDFPSNGDSPASAFVAFQFNNPQNNGLPIWGPNNQGATYMWKYRPKQQTGYYVTMWWSNNGSFLWNNGSPNTFYGAHPYPDSANNTGTTHSWEIATEFGGDYMTTKAGNKKAVVKNVWYTQALQVVPNADGTKTMTFYINLPSTAAGDVIQVVVPANYGNINPPSPAITFGDSPWYASYQHERLSGILRGIKIFNKTLSESEILTEATSDAVVTSSGNANIWYHNPNPTPDDIADKSGKGHNPVWADSANKAKLWSSSGTTPTPSVPTISVTASPTNITSGQSSTLSWSSTNATSCTGSGGWTGAKATTGTQSVSPITSTTYTLACTGAGGTDTQSVTVWVGTATPNPPATSGTISSVAAGMAAGTWTQVTTSGLNAALMNIDPNHILGFADSAVWDPGSKQFMIVGGAHAPAQPTNQRHIVFSESNNTWRAETNAPWFCPPSTGTGCVRHPYDHHTINPTTGDMYVRGFGSLALQKYNIPTKTWSTISGATIGNCCGAIAYFPEMNSIISVGGGRVDRYNLSTGTWTQVTSGLAMGDYHNFAEYNPVGKFVYFGGGNGSQDLYKITSAGTITKLTNAPITFGVPTATVVTDPVSGDLLVLMKQTTAGFYKYNATTNAWSTLTTYPFSSANNQDLAVVGAPIPEYGVVMYLKYGFEPGQVWLYKHAAGTGTPAPTTPTVSLSASPTSITTGGSAVLTWSSQNATSCTSSGGWTGARSTSGNFTVSPTANTTYTLVCTGAGGTATQSVFLTVTAPVSTKFSLNDRVTVVNGPLNVRSTANTAGTLLGTQSNSSLGTVVGGPTAQGGYNWWQINYDAGVDGWSVEDYLIDYVVPTPAPTSTSPVPSGATVTTFSLTSPLSGTMPFTVGLGFKKGEVTGTPSLALSDQQVIVTRRWNDGSAKHAIASGHVSLTANSPRLITVVNTATNLGTPLTAASIQAANPQASVTLGSYGTVNLSSLLASPVRTFISGPEMVEAHYRSSIGSDPLLSVWFHVRYYKNGRTWIRTVVENGYLNNVTNATRSYVPSISIGGSSVYTNGGTALTHYANTSWSQEGWIGGDPQVTPKHDTNYLMATGLVPNYWKKNPSSSALSSLLQTYTPMNNGSYTADMGNTGYQSQIGLLPNWEALYLNSDGDARAYRSVISNAKSINSYPIVWRDNTTKEIIRPSQFAAWTASGNNQGGENGWTAGSLYWETAHHPSAGYLAYLLTGDYLYLENSGHQAAMCYLMRSAAYGGQGTSRILTGQTRATAWCLRTLGQYAAISPLTTVAEEYRTLFANNITFWDSQTKISGQNQLGIIYDNEYVSNAYGVGNSAPWQQNFFVQAVGYASDLEPISVTTDLNSVKSWLYRIPVGLLGGNGSGQFCFTKAGAYNIKTGPTTGDVTTMYDTWGEVHTATFGSANTSCGNTLEGSSGGAPNVAATGYWGNLLPAIAYAVEDGAPGAADAWTRLTGATNWSAVSTSGFDDTPVWGIYPRTVTVTPPSTTPTVSLSASPTSVATGQSSTLSWSSTNVTTCTGSGGWTGARSTSGNFTVSPTANTTYTLACTGAGGTVTQSVTVTITTSASTKFSLNDRVSVVNGPLNVRSTANTAGTLLGTQANSSLGTVVSGPTAQGGYNWWNINYDSGADGWSVEDYLVKYTTPTPPTASNVCIVGKSCYALPSQAFAAAVNGDTVEIKAGTYDDVSYIDDSNLTIRGINGRPHIRANGTNAGGKGTWVVTGNNTIIDNIEMSGASVPDQNGAAIRQEGLNLTLRNAYIHDNENGILSDAGNSTITIENSEFANNGFGDGFTHNLYIGNINKLVMRGVWSHNAKVGHLLKSRAKENDIQGNRFTDQGGTASYEADFPNGGKVTFAGNIIEQSATTQNPGIIAFAAEGASNPVQELRVYQNTIVNNRTSGGTFIQVSGSPSVRDIQGNIYVGTGAPTDANNKTVALSALVNPTQYDYRLSSPQGGASALAQYEYVHTAGSRTRSDSVYGAYSGTVTPPPTPAPTVSLTASPTSITSGQSSTLTWSSTNATSCTASGGWTGTRSTSGTLSVSPTTNTTYTLTCGTATQSTTVTVTAAPDTTAPTAPGTPTVTPVSASSLSLTWAAASDASGVTGYRVERCTGSSCTSYTQVATPTGTTYTDTGLTAATVYRYRVRATDAALNLSAYSGAGNGTTNSVLDTTAPTVPGTPSITAPSAGTLSLTWAASTDSGAGLARYRVERCLGTTCTTYTQVGTPTTPAFVNTGLTSGTAYRYRVRAEDQAGNLSGYSTPASQTTVTVTPVDTTVPTLSNILASGSADAAVITGTTNEPARLRVDYGLTPTSLTNTLSTTTLTTAHSLTLPSLTRRTTYSYRLTVTDQAGNSTQSTVRSFTTGKGKTAPIKNLNAVYGSVILSWGALEDPFATTIAIHRTQNGTFPAVTDTSTRLATLSDKTIRTYRDTTAKDGTTYSYTLYAIDDEGTASDPAMITFTPKAPTSSGGGGGGGGGGKPKPKPTPVPTPTPTPTTPTLPSTPVITPPTTPSTPTTVTTPAFTEPLFVGSQNAEVLKLQNYLISLDFLAADSATGLYGPATEAAVKRYQCARSIVCGGTGADTGYGLVGNATRTQLNREVKGTTTTVSTPTTTTTTTLTPEARQVLIQSLLQQVAILMARLQAMRGS